MGNQQSSQAPVAMRAGQHPGMTAAVDHVTRLSKGVDGGVSQKNIVHNDVMDVSMLLGSTKQRERIWNYSFSPPRGDGVPQENQQSAIGPNSGPHVGPREGGLQPPPSDLHDLYARPMKGPHQKFPDFHERPAAPGAGPTDGSGLGDAGYTEVEVFPVERDSEAEFFRDRDDGKERTVATEIFFKRTSQEQVPYGHPKTGSRQDIQPTANGELNIPLWPVLNRLFRVNISAESEFGMKEMLVKASSGELHAHEAAHGRVGLPLLAKWIPEVDFQKPALQLEQVNDIVEFVTIQLEARGEEMSRLTSFDVALMPVRVRGLYQDWHRNAKKNLLEHITCPVEPASTDIDGIINDFFSVVYICHAMSKQPASRPASDVLANNQETEVKHILRDSVERNSMVVVVDDKARSSLSFDNVPKPEDINVPPQHMVSSIPVDVEVPRHEGAYDIIVNAVQDENQGRNFTEQVETRVVTPVTDVAISPPQPSIVPTEVSFTQPVDNTNHAPSLPTDGRNVLIITTEEQNENNHGTEMYPPPKQGAEEPSDVHSFNPYDLPEEPTTSSYTSRATFTKVETKVEEPIINGHPEESNGFDSASYDLDQTLYTSKPDVDAFHTNLPHHDNGFGVSNQDPQWSTNSTTQKGQQKPKAIDGVKLISIGSYHFNENGASGREEAQPIPRPKFQRQTSAEIYHHQDNVTSHPPRRDPVMDFPFQDKHDRAHSTASSHTMSHLSSLLQGSRPMRAMDPLLTGKKVSASLFVHDNAVFKMPIVNTLPITFHPPRRVPSWETLEKSMTIDFDFD